MKKGILSVLLILTALFSTGCSTQNKTANEDSSIKVSVENEEDEQEEINNKISKQYEEIQKSMESQSVPQEDLEKFKKNVPIMKDLNKKANESCKNGFYVEAKITNSRENVKNHYVKTYFIEGSSRQEEYKNDKLAYLTIYNKDTDTMYFYEADKDDLKTTTKYSKKNKGHYPYEFGFFTLGNNAIKGNFQKIDYKGKKAIYSKFVFTSTDNSDKSFMLSSMYWYDAETGILMREEQKDTDSNSYRVDYTIKFDQQFDKDTFKFDKNNLTQLSQ